MAQLVIPTRLQQGLDSRITLFQQSMKDGDRIQTMIMIFILAGVKAAVNTMSGPEAWLTTTKNELGVLPWFRSEPATP